MKCVLAFTAFLTCFILASCTNMSDRQAGNASVVWGRETDGVCCGLAASKETYVLGEGVAIRVVLKNTRAEPITCNVSTIQSYRLTKDGVREMHLIVDATGDQYLKGTEVRIPSGQSIQILSQTFPTRPAGNFMSDIHFTAESTPIRVICTPLFDKKDGPLLAGDVSGASSGVITVQVSEGTKDE